MEQQPREARDWDHCDVTCLKCKKLSKETKQGKCENGCSRKQHKRRKAGGAPAPSPSPPPPPPTPIQGAQAPAPIAAPVPAPAAPAPAPAPAPAEPDDVPLTPEGAIED